MYTRKDFHKDIDKLLDEKGYGDDLQIAFGRLAVEVTFQNGHVMTKVIDRETFRERSVAPATG